MKPFEHIQQVVRVVESSIHLTMKVTEGNKRFAKHCWHIPLVIKPSSDIIDVVYSIKTSVETSKGRILISETIESLPVGVFVSIPRVVLRIF